MAELTAWVEGLGVLGPGLEGWTATGAILRGTSPYIAQPTVLPMPERLPPAERRRLGRVVKLALAVGQQAVARAGVNPVVLPSVFSSSGGDGHNCHEICEALARDEKAISPTRFHNSVHNAAAGYWSIATGATATSNALCAFDASFGAGLLECVTQVVADRTRVLLVAYDAQYPAPLFAKRPIPDAFGVAMVLAPNESRAREMTRVSLSFSNAPADTMADSSLESLRASIPAARSLPLLRQIALGSSGSVHIDYLGQTTLSVDVDTCA